MRLQRSWKVEEKRSRGGPSFMRRTSPMSPSAETLYRHLKSESPTVRLEAARYLADYAEVHDEQALREALANERIQWIRSALQRAIARVSPQSADVGAEPSVDRDDLPAGF